MPTLLITRPKYEPTTFCLFSWNKLIIDHAKSVGIKVIDLSEERAKKDELMSIMKKVDPDLVILNGHGSDDHINGQDHKVLIKVGENTNILKEKIVFALSCKTGMTLGQDCIDKGSKAYIGYKNDFIFFQKKGFETRPLFDPWAKLFLEPTNQIGISLLNGNTAGEAHIRGKNKFLEKAQELASHNSGDLFLVQSLILNYYNQVCLGDKNAKIF